MKYHDILHYVTRLTKIRIFKDLLSIWYLQTTIIDYFKPLLNYYFHNCMLYHSQKIFEFWLIGPNGNRLRIVYCMIETRDLGYLVLEGLHLTSVYYGQFWPNKTSLADPVTIPPKSRTLGFITRKLIEVHEIF